MEEYKIGNYVFNSKEEYNKALREYAFIKSIMKKYNIKNPVVAKEILKIIEERKVRFSTKIGKDFIKILSNNIEKEKKQVIVENENGAKKQVLM